MWKNFPTEREVSYQSRRNSQFPTNLDVVELMGRLAVMTLVAHASRHKKWHLALSCELAMYHVM